MGHCTVAKVGQTMLYDSTAFGSDSTGSGADFGLPNKVFDGFRWFLMIGGEKVVDQLTFCVTDLCTTAREV